MDLFIINVIDGLIYGLLLFMLSSGLTLIFSMMGVLNLSHAAFYMLGAYLAYQISVFTGFWVGLILWSINAYTTLFNFDYNLVTGFLLASLGSGVSYAISTVFGDDGIRIEK